MPSTYAHYRFGAAMLAAMPADAKRTVGRFRRLYDVGLHGPDLFYYHSPVLKGGVHPLGAKYHQQTGREFFQRVCRVARLENSEAATAYLYGVLCHYALDSACHPLVLEQAEKGPACHTAIEREFDRFLLEMDGKFPPESQDLSNHIRLTPGECETVSKFYPGTTARQIQQCLKLMSTTNKLVSVPEGARRTVLRSGMGLLGDEVVAMLMTTGPDPKCAALDPLLLENYQQAVDIFPELLRQLQAHMTYNGVFGEEFTKKFG